jgi:hypothetical protein
MCLDLNRILMYGNPDGSFRTADRPKRFFSIVDGIVGMEGNGPVAGTPIDAGVVLAGCSPAAVDATCARLMGFDVAKLPLVWRAFEEHVFPLCRTRLSDIQVRSNVAAWDRELAGWQRDSSLDFRPHFGWVGHVEL